MEFLAKFRDLFCVFFFFFSPPEVFGAGERKEEEKAGSVHPKARKKRRKERMLTGSMNFEDIFPSLILLRPPSAFPNVFAKDSNLV